MSEEQVTVERCSWLERNFGRFVLWVLGWELIGRVPPLPKFVLIGAPHTAGLDLPVLLAATWSYGVRIRWFAKAETFEIPLLGRWLLRVGGVPVDRSAPQGLVEQMVAEFAARDSMVLMVPPAGTRKRLDHWKSGFYHIALGAGVPVVASTADYGRKQTGVLGVVHLTGEPEADMDQLRALYADVTPRYPELLTPIRLRAEIDGE